MNKVFPAFPIIGEPKLTLDDFGENWWYRKDCRDITMKLTQKDAAQKLWEETAAAPKHIITQLLNSALPPENPWPSISGNGIIGSKRSLWAFCALSACVNSSKLWLLNLTGWNWPPRLWSPMSTEAVFISRWPRMATRSSVICCLAVFHGPSSIRFASLCCW